MKVTMISIVIRTDAKGSMQGLEELEIREWVEIIQTTALLRSARILRRVLDICCHSASSGKLSANADVKNSPESMIIIIILAGNL